ncbi:MAG: hypothetical protein S4CHLAM81_12390 [Chlamydiales bacterium]|nr:hypothetical protein [Chlamydiales bacterium]MCH9636014.1 hypothetical protein [Chlamydiales bacterium]
MLQDLVEEKVHSRNFHTLEIRFSADDIMRRHKNELLKGKGYSYLEPKLAFYPYLMMDMKFSRDHIFTEEGMLLWGLYDGEMVIDTGSWETSHGFEDCLLVHASKNDFKVLRAILEMGSAIDREQLYKKFKVEPEVVDKWVASCRDKKLIVSSGNKFRIHLQNPQIESIPITNLAEPLVTQPTKSAVKMKKRYSVSQIKKLTEIAFGSNFAIRKMQQVFLPVYQIAIQNPDGSVRTTYWNALNGEAFDTQ